MDIAPISRESLSPVGAQSSPLAVDKDSGSPVQAVSDSVDIRHRTIDRLELVRLRIASGYYNTPAAMDMLATRLSTLI